MNCPLCNDSKQMRKAKPLYDKMVCKKCYYKFTNRRQMAYLIDALVWQLISNFIGIAFGLLMVSILPGISQQQLFWGGTAVGYVVFLVFACKDGFTGHSLGKAITGVQVVNEDTYEPIGFSESFKRNLCLIIPFVIFVIVYQMPKGKRLGDKWANTRVIWKKYRSHPVFTGAALEDAAETFIAGDGRSADASDNPFAAPRE